MCGGTCPSCPGETVQLSGGLLLAAEALGPTLCGSCADVGGMWPPPGAFSQG